MAERLELRSTHRYSVLDQCCLNGFMAGEVLPMPGYTFRDIVLVRIGQEKVVMRLTNLHYFNLDVEVKTPSKYYHCPRPLPTSLVATALVSVMVATPSSQIALPVVPREVFKTALGLPPTVAMLTGAAPL